jgi:energy-coupling factor transporter ATP-binding protein EcfA2
LADKIALGKFNVLVGPNNSGKSQTLRDIRDYVASGSTARLTILSELEVDLPTSVEAVKDLNLLPHDSPEHTRVRGVQYDLQNPHEFAIQNNWIEERFKDLNPGNVSQLLQHLGKFWVAHLDAESPSTHC